MHEGQAGPDQYLVGKGAAALSHSNDIFGRLDSHATKIRRLEAQMSGVLDHLGLE